jgi:hypothetical protein
MIRQTWIARLFVVALTGAAVATTAGSASAGLLPVSVTVQPEAGNFRWTYSVVLPTNMQLQAGNYFTIYDFAGYMPGTAMVTAGTDPSNSSNWKISSSNVGPTPGRLNPQDDPNIPNVTFTYTGPTIPAGFLALGNFSVDSTFQATTPSFFTAVNAQSTTGTGKEDDNITPTLVPLQPGPPPPPPHGTPEPATLVLAGIGLPLVGLSRYLRRKGQPVAA